MVVRKTQALPSHIHKKAGNFLQHSLNCHIQKKSFQTERWVGKKKGKEKNRHKPRKEIFQSSEIFLII